MLGPLPDPLWLQVDHQSNGWQLACTGPEFAYFRSKIFETLSPCTAALRNIPLFQKCTGEFFKRGINKKKKSISQFYHLNFNPLQNKDSKMIFLIIYHLKFFWTRLAYRFMHFDDFLSPSLSRFSMQYILRWSCARELLRFTKSRAGVLRLMYLRKTHMPPNALNVNKIFTWHRMEPKYQLPCTWSGNCIFPGFLRYWLTLLYFCYWK